MRFFPELNQVVGMLWCINFLHPLELFKFFDESLICMYLILIALFAASTSRRHLIAWKYNTSGCVTALKCKTSLESLAYSEYLMDSPEPFSMFKARYDFSSQGANLDLQRWSRRGDHQMGADAIQSLHVQVTLPSLIYPLWYCITRSYVSKAPVICNGYISVICWFTAARSISCWLKHAKQRRRRRQIRRNLQHPRKQISRNWKRRRRIAKMRNLVADMHSKSPHFPRWVPHPPISHCWSQYVFHFVFLHNAWLGSMHSVILWHLAFPDWKLCQHDL